MAKSVEVSRVRQSRTELRTVKLSQIVLADDGVYCHRDAKALEKKALAGLTDSLVQEGQATPLVVYEEGGKYVLVSGHRRYKALRLAIEQHMAVGHISDDMDVNVTVMIPGEGQKPVDFQRDVYVCSVAENEQRQNLDAKSRLEVVREFRRRKIANSRAASALGISTTQYDRDAKVVALDFLYEAVQKDQIGPSDAARLAEAASGTTKDGVKHDHVDHLREQWATWVAECEAKVAVEAKAAEKLDKPFPDSQRQLKRFMNSALAKQFMNAIKDEEPFTAETRIPFGVEYDTKQGKLVIKGVDAKLSTLDAKKVLAILVEYRRGFEKLATVYEQVRAMTQKVPTEKVNRLWTELAEEAKKTEQEEAGRKPQDEVTPEVVEEDFADGVDEDMEALLDEESGNNADEENAG